MMKWKVAAAAAVLPCMMMVGCGGVAQSGKVTDLETRVSELEASNAELQRQLNEVNTRLQMLQARVSVAAPAVSSSATPPANAASNFPNLEVFKLKPAAPAASPAPAAPAKPAASAAPKSLTAWPQQPVFRTASGKSISLPKATEPAPEPGGESAPPPAAAAPAKPGDSAKAQGAAVFQDAMQLFDDKKYAEALVKFQQVTEDAKAADLHDNARYWMGECYYVQGDFQAAVEEFIRLANDYPESDKAPEALYKGGLAYEELNQREAALETLREVVVLYPFSDSARLAEEKIKEWSR